MTDHTTPAKPELTWGVVRPLPTPCHYARYLVHLIKEEWPNGIPLLPLDNTEVRSWQQLHEICDANEFLMDADEHFGIDPWEVIGNTDDQQYEDEVFAEWVMLTNAAISLVEETLWG